MKQQLFLLSFLQSNILYSQETTPTIGKFEFSRNVVTL